MKISPTKYQAARYLVPVIAILVPIALVGPNTLLGLYACAVLFVGSLALWRPEEPPVLIFLFGYQWLQANILAFYGNLQGLPLAAYADYPGAHEEAVALTNTGLLVLALAIRLAAGRPRRGLGPWLKSMLATQPARVWILAYSAAWIFSSLCAAAAPFAGGLRQPLLILAELKWAGFLLLTASTFAVPGRSKMPWLIAVTVELALSLGGFFGDFKITFFYAIIGLSFLGTQFLRRHSVLLIACGVLMLTFAVAWTAVKRDYREFISGGTREQVVLVGYGDRLPDLFDRVMALDGPLMVEGADKLARRISYYEFFGVVLRRADRQSASTGGAIWGEALLSPLMPRLIFPNKPVIDDTKLTIEHTGINPASWRNGVSVSMGYMAEAFIDFGPIFMFFAIAGLGGLIGSIYRWLINQQGRRLVIGLGLAPMAVMPAHLLEVSILKLFPTLILSVLACWVTLNFIGPRLLTAVGAFRRPASLVQKPSS